MQIRICAVQFTAIPRRVVHGYDGCLRHGRCSTVIGTGARLPMLSDCASLLAQLGKSKYVA